MGKKRGRFSRDMKLRPEITNALLAFADVRKRCSLLDISAEGWLHGNFILSSRDSRQPARSIFMQIEAKYGTYFTVGLL